MAEIKKISTELQLLDKFLDTSGDAGTAGQVLTSTGTGINWVSAGTPGSGVYLPLAGGTMTGSIVFNNNVAETWKDNAGATTRMMILNSTNVAYIGPIDTYAGGPILYGTSADVTAQIFYTGASERMRITSAGNVGIGTTSPGAKLQVYSAASTNVFITGYGTSAQNDWGAQNAMFVKTDNGLVISKQNAQNNTNRLYTFYNDASGNAEQYIHNTSNIATIKLDSAGDSYFNGGNVGIGTTSPSYPLDVVGDGIRLTRNSKTFIFNADFASAGTHANIQSDAGMGLSFSTNVSEKMRITSAGNIGIGTTSPIVKLQVDTGNNLVAAFFKSGANSVPVSVFNAGNTVSTIGFKGSTSTSEYHVRVGADSKDFVAYTNNTEKLRILENGNVGIGTTSPQRNLTIYQSSGNAVLQLANNTSGVGASDGFLAYTDGVNVGLENKENGYLSLATNASEKMRITSAGNVGIGTTSPAAKLHVDDSVGGKLRLSNISATADGEKIGGIETGVANGTFFAGVNFFRHDANDGEIRFRTKVNNTNTDVMAIVDGNVGVGTTSPSANLDILNGTTGASLKLSATATAYWQLQRNPTTGNLNISDDALGNVMSFDQSTGNVGIGTTSPTAGRKLDVHGDIELTEDLFIGAASSSRGEHKIKIGQNRSGNGYAYIDLIGDQAATSFYNLRIIRNNTGANATSQIIHKGTGNFSIDASNSADIILNPGTANVGIGTTSPGAKLSVNGNVKIEGTNSLLFGGSASIPSWAINHNGSDLLIDDQGGNIGSVLFNNSEGVALPRLTTAQINAISSPAQGLMAYNTTLNTICFYNGSSWQKVSHANM